MILDDPIISKRVFFPRGTDAEPTLVVDVGGVTLGCHIHQRHEGAGYVLYFHGNGELAADYSTNFADMFLDMGVNVCFAEYRGYGRSTGSPALAAMRGDGEHIVRAMGVEPEKIVAFGRSLGSLYAVELASRLPSLAGLVLESGISNVGDHWTLPEQLAEMGRSSEELVAAFAQEFDNEKKLAGYRGPLLVLHAKGDRLVESAHGERLHEWAGGDDKRLVVFPQGDHNTIFFANFVEYVREVKEFVQRAGITQ